MININNNQPVLQNNTNSLSVSDCLNNIIQYSSKSIIFYNNNLVYKQYPIKELNWINEIFIVNYLNKTQTVYKNIIKFIKCEIIDDYIINAKKNEIYLDKKEKVIRITMIKYKHTLNQLNHFNDDEIFIIMHKLLLSVLYCLSKDILHRDIKEKNIFINYTELSLKFNKKKRKITDVILADFNISSINYYVHSLKKVNINTRSHRSPEICKAIYNNNKINYGEKTDVWSFCIVVSFLITNRSFYSFLNDGYLQISPNIMHNVNKLLIAMKHFLKIYANNKLKYITLYKKIIFMGIVHINDRCTFQNIFDVINKYNKTHGKYNLVFLTPDKNSPPLTSNSKLIVDNTKCIRLLHTFLNVDDSVLLLFYKLIVNDRKFIKSNKFDELNKYLFTVYILMLFVSDDNHKNLNHYIQIYNNLNSPNKLNQLTFDQIILQIQKLLQIHNFCIL
jgi:serine/threonine protein kinase